MSTECHEIKKNRNKLFAHPYFFVRLQRKHRNVLGLKMPRISYHCGQTEVCVV